MRVSSSFLSNLLVAALGAVLVAISVAFAPAIAMCAVAPAVLIGILFRTRLLPTARGCELLAIAASARVQS